MILWSSAFITSKIIVDNAPPFLSLSIRFGIVAFLFFLFFLFFSKDKYISFKAFKNASISGLLFHGFYLGGVFYSINILPEFWRNISLGNPMLYVVNIFREGMIGISDVSIPFSLFMIVMFIFILTISCLHLLNKGTGIRQ